MQRRASFFFVVATFAFGSLGMSPCHDASPCSGQVDKDKIVLTTNNDDWFLEISAMGPCHVFDSRSREATIQVDGAGICVMTGSTALAGEFRVERLAETFTTNCGDMVLGVRDEYLRQFNVSKRDGGVGVAQDAI